MNSVIINDTEYRKILQDLDHLIQDAETLSDSSAKELLYSILNYLDSVHREPLLRMIKLIEKHEFLKSELASDHTVDLLLKLYDIKNPLKEDKKENHGGFVGIDQVKILTPIKKTEWVEIGNIEDFHKEKFYPKNFSSVNFLISRIDKGVYAVQNSCPDSILPIDLGKLIDHYIICPWHGCQFDLITGGDRDNPSRKLETYQVTQELNGNLKVGIPIS